MRLLRKNERRDDMPIWQKLVLLLGFLFIAGLIVWATEILK
jgi:hypothetical protein